MSGGKFAENPCLPRAADGAAAFVPTEILSIAINRLLTRPSFFCGENPEDSSARSWGVN